MARDARGRFTSGGGKGRIRWTENTLIPGVNGFDIAVNKIMAASTELHATKAEAEMRANASWRDRTGNARAGLRAEAFHELNRHGIDLFHSVPYGIWLEVRWGGRYAIIDPTLQRQGIEVMKTIASLMRVMKVG